MDKKPFVDLVCDGKKKNNRLGMARLFQDQGSGTTVN